MKIQLKQIGTAKRGYPVYEKMTMFDDKGAESVSILDEVIELSNATLSADLFDVPADYREVKDPSQLYASMSTSGSNNSTSTGNNSGINQNVKNRRKTTAQRHRRLSAQKKKALSESA